MTTKEFLKNITLINDIINDQNEVISFIENIAAKYNEYFKLSVQLKKSFVAGNPTDTFNKMSRIISPINELDRQTLIMLREYKPYTIVTKLNELESELKKISILKKEMDGFKDDLKKLINCHTDAYSEKGFEEIFAFVSYSSIFIEKLKKIQFASEIFLDNLQLEPIFIPEKNQLFEIQIISQLENLENFSSFLLFLDKLYQDLCKSFEIHYEDFPLTIVKIESGSIWSKLFGNKELISLIKDFVFGLAHYIRDLQTGQIKKEQFENNVLKAGLILDLIDKANQIGLKEDKKVLLEKAFGQAVINFSKALPKTTTEIIVDDTKILNLNPKETKLIENRQPLLLKKNNGKPKKK